MRGKRITLAEVARRAGVSVGTASAALNGKQTLAPQTRARVLQAAQELHYTPNALIRALQTGETHTIGVFTWSFHDDAWRALSFPIFRGVALGVAAIGYDMLVYSETPKRRRAQNVPPFLDRRVDGVICSAPAPDLLARLVAAGMPVVTLHYQDLPPEVGSVDIDDYGGALEMTKYLLSLGHRRIAFDGSGSSRGFAARAAGYQDALRAYGITPDPTLLLAAKSGFTPFPEAAARLLECNPRPTALFAATDDRAFGWLELLQQRGIRVPEDISLAGFDDAPGAAIPPGLTTVHQPWEEIGLAAARMTERLIHGAAPSECRVVFPLSLRIRRSTAPPPPRQRGISNPDM